MRDILETLQGLPPRCAVVMDGQAMFIRRGARDPDPALIPTTQVDQWNEEHGVTEAQVQAMLTGLTLGWDRDEVTLSENLTTYGFIAVFDVPITVQARTEEEAIALARKAAPHIEGAVMVALDLIETE